MNFQGCSSFVVSLLLFCSFGLSQGAHASSSSVMTLNDFVSLSKQTWQKLQGSNENEWIGFIQDEKVDYNLFENNAKLVLVKFVYQDKGTYYFFDASLNCEKRSYRVFLIASYSSNQWSIVGEDVREVMQQKNYSIEAKVELQMLYQYLCKKHYNL